MDFGRVTGEQFRGLVSWFGLAVVGIGALLVCATNARGDLHGRDGPIELVGALNVLRIAELARESLETVVIVVEETVAGQVADAGRSDR